MQNCKQKRVQPKKSAILLYYNTVVYSTYTLPCYSTVHTAGVYLRSSTITLSYTVTYSITYYHYYTVGTRYCIERMQFTKCAHFTHTFHFRYLRTS
jgi:hypothetical protein